MSSPGNVIDWSLCCLCQLDKKGETLQNPKVGGFISLEKDLTDLNDINPPNLPSGINVKFTQLDDGSGIAITLRSNGEKYHKLCRS